MRYNRGLVLFHRNLRLDDNCALQRAVDLCHEIVPLFVLSPVQVGTRNAFRSENAIQFMIESLRDFDDELRLLSSRLYCAWGTAQDILSSLLQQHVIDAVFVHRDYTSFAQERNATLASICAREKVAFCVVNDVLLTEPEQVRTASGDIYSVFTSFFKVARKFAVPEPRRFTARRQLFNGRLAGLTTLDAVLKHIAIKRNPDCIVQGGAQAARVYLRAVAKAKHQGYSRNRDYPHLNTTLLSAYLKFGCVSIRQVYHTIVKVFSLRHLLIEQLYWRDFFTHIAYHFPHVFAGAFHKKYDALCWQNDKKLFKVWCRGKTGFPIIDAGMRQLNTTGWMHNRVRMIAASFLVKDLLIDWRWGEKYFAQQLVDYDPSVNNGNWQWIASTGCDAQPYFRIFNPWLQQKKYDVDCAYIKQWVPELEQLSSKEIHALAKEPLPGSCSYPAAMVDHAACAKRAKELYKRLV